MSVTVTFEEMGTFIYVVPPLRDSNPQLTQNGLRKEARVNRPAKKPSHRKHWEKIEKLREFEEKKRQRELRRRSQTAKRVIAINAKNTEDEILDSVAAAN